MMKLLLVNVLEKRSYFIKGKRLAPDIPIPPRAKFFVGADNTLL